MQQQSRAATSDVPWYRFIDDDIRERTRADVGYTNLLSTRPYPMDDATLAGFVGRYATVRRYQEITRDLFLASLRGDADPAVAETILAGQPPERGREFHLSLGERHLRLPLFFRTDEAAPGAIAEIQCPASGWEIADQTRSLYEAFAGDFGRPERFDRSLFSRLAASMRSCLGEEPVVHHLTNNASRPHGVVYTVQRLREEGIRHFSWDPVRWQDCNLVRAHEFYDLRYNGFFDQWMDACEAGRLWFDHPPTPLYDAKAAMAWPFSPLTREHYPDEVRDIFPHTDIVTEEGFRLEDGSRISLDDYCKLGQGKRTHYLKFGGHHPTVNWGSRAVYYAGSFSRPALEKLFERILADRAAGHPWVAQSARSYPETTTAMGRDGEEIKADVYTKFSGYYTSDGLAGIMVMQERSRKVHGSARTVLSIVH